MKNIKFWSVFFLLGMGAHFSLFGEEGDSLVSEKEPFCQGIEVVAPEKQSTVQETGSQESVLLKESLRTRPFIKALRRLSFLPYSFPDVTPLENSLKFFSIILFSKACIDLGFHLGKILPSHEVYFFFSGALGVYAVSYLISFLQAQNKRKYILNQKEFILKNYPQEIERYRTSFDFIYRNFLEMEEILKEKGGKRTLQRACLWKENQQVIDEIQENLEGPFSPALKNKINQRVIKRFENISHQLDSLQKELSFSLFLFYISVGLGEILLFADYYKKFHVDFWQSKTLKIISAFCLFYVPFWVGQKKDLSADALLKISSFQDPSLLKYGFQFLQGLDMYKLKDYTSFKGRVLSAQEGILLSLKNLTGRWLALFSEGDRA